MKIRIDGTPEEIEQAAHIFGPSCGPIKITKKREGGNFGYLEVDERQKIICLDCETTGLDPTEDAGGNPDALPQFPVLTRYCRADASFGA